MQSLKDFDPNGLARADAGIFGLPFSPEDAQVVLLPAPWGVTVSYAGGTHNGPKAMFDASMQLDVFHPSYGSDSWKIGVAMLPLKDWDDAYNEGVQLRTLAKEYIENLEQGKSQPVPKELNDACARFHARVSMTALQQMGKGKLVGLIGGDHSTALGLIQAVAENHPEFGILQVDAHCDLRDSYEGFTFSHASIMWNALKSPQVKKLVQVGIRDYSVGESEVIKNSNGRIQTFFDADMRQRQFEGARWAEIVQDIVNALPEKVYISFDIDGLDPSLCPNTGTPVPGGLRFQEAAYLIQAVAKAGKKIVGFDVNEVSPAEGSEWNENVGMRVLWNIAMWAAKSNQLKPVA